MGGKVFGWPACPAIMGKRDLISAHLFHADLFPFLSRTIVQFVARPLIGLIPIWLPCRWISARVAVVQGILLLNG